MDWRNLWRIINSDRWLFWYVVNGWVVIAILFVVAFVYLAHQ
jgi:hypothetical protein